METISLRFKYTEEEFVAATRLYLRRSADFIVRLAVCSLYAVACFFLMSWLGFSSDVLPIFIVAACLPFLLGFVHFFVLPRQRFRSDPKFKDGYFLEFSDDGIHFRTAQIDALIQWSLYTKVLEDDRFYLLVYGKHMISVIPKRAFTSATEQSAFDELLRRKLPACFNSQLSRKRVASEVARTYVPPTSPPDWR